MALLERLGVLRASPSAPDDHNPDEGADDNFALNDFEEELKRLSAVNQELLHEYQQHDEPRGDRTIASAVGLAPADAEEMELLRLENAELKARIQELEALKAGKGEELWLERQREYEMLLEEKSEVIRGLHQKIQEVLEAQESAIGGSDNAPANTNHASSVSCSGTRLGQAEEILRLKREIEDQRRQLERDEEEMMAQMRQMELTMAKERAEMARHRQEVQRLQADLAREIEQSSRDPELRERLNNLRRTQEPRPPSGATPTPAAKPEQRSSGFFRRIFG